MNTDEKLVGDLYESLFDSITDEEVKELGIKTDDEKFAITNEDQAMFFLRKVNELREERDHINNICNKQIESFTEKVNSWRNSQVYTIDNTENYFISLLEEYARIQLSDSKKKSIKYPFGTLSFKKMPDKYVYDDETLMHYIKERDLNQFIRVKEEINKKDLKSALTIKDGAACFNDEKIEGVAFEPGIVKFSIK